ncbi:MAG: substrate-binding domain-containing protein, partial [Thermomicrobiales bacterium]|nr:substrate-binding domain-containing protein [Thermomicrobiales bacterium]
MTIRHSRRGVVLGAAAILGGLPVARTALAWQTDATPATEGELVAPGIEVAGVPPAIDRTRGPNGETATGYQDVRLTADEVAKVRESGSTAAIVMHTSSAWSRAVEQGAVDAFAALGMDVVAQTDAGMDPAKQQSDAETVLALNPSVILTLPIDPVQAAAAFRPAVDAGVHLVFIDNPAEGFEQGKDYVGIVTGDHFALGQATAEMLADATGGEGRVGYIFHDADFYVTNQRDQAFKSVLQERYPGLEIAAEQGMADPADGESIASAMLTRDPSITAFYVPWAEPAEGVLAALRAAGRDDVEVVTIDLDTTVALDMAQGGSVVGIAADTPYVLGYTLALMGAYAVLGKDAPPFTIVPTVKVTRDNLPEGWQASLHEEVPQEIL